jgi:DNA-binding transcriptional LysR family regulator
MLVVDLLAACRAFVSVGERGSFTLGAAAAGVPQPVASRRVAALERHFGQRLFDRSARRAVLTAFGRDLLDPAKRLIEMADGLVETAARAKLRPLTVAIPVECPVRLLARWRAAAHDEGTVLQFQPAGPAQRAELVRTGQVRAALIAVMPDAADWVVPLGVAFAPAAARRPAAFRLEALRPGRDPASARQLWIQPEDDTVHVGGELARLGSRHALLPAQIAVAASLTAAASEVLRGRDLLLCPAAQAEELELAWRPLRGDPVARGYRVEAVDNDDAITFRQAWHDEVARSLGAR